MGLIPLHFRFDEIDSFIKIYDRIRSLVLFGGSFHNEIFNGIVNLTIKKVVLQIVLIIIS